MSAITGTVGRLGKGKTFCGVLWLYEGYCLGLDCYSNIPVAFPHVPIKTPRDFAKMRDGRALLDEFWIEADNRRAMSLKSLLTTLVCLRSRKKRMSLFYTQQYLQIDPRIAYVTTRWIRPSVYPYDPEGIDRIKPEILIQERWDGDFNQLPTLRFEDLDPYLALYDTEQDPYSVKDFLSENELSDAIAEIKDGETVKELKQVTECAKMFDKREMLATL